MIHRDRDPLLERIPVDLIHLAVMRGLDPRIHHLRKIYAKRMDPRAKPAGDGRGWASADSNRPGAAVATSRGFILVAALWIIAALATLASIFSIYLANTAMSLSLNDSIVQSEALVVASLELTAYQVSAPPPARRDANVPPRPTRGDFGFRLGRADVAVNFVTEAARI